jgi:hypothetical protein
MTTEKQPTTSLTDTKMAKNLASLSSEQRLEIQATLQQMEAREWLKRYRKKAMEEGKAEALDWWHRTLSDLVKRRGRAAVDELRKRMNEIK